MTLGVRQQHSPMQERCDLSQFWGTDTLTPSKHIGKLQGPYQCTAWELESLYLYFKGTLTPVVWGWQAFMMRFTDPSWSRFRNPPSVFPQCLVFFYFHQILFPWPPPPCQSQHIPWVKECNRSREVFLASCLLMSLCLWGSLVISLAPQHCYRREGWGEGKVRATVF